MAEENQDSEISSLPFEERLNYYKSQKIINVTNGLGWLIKDADELMDLNTEMLQASPSQGRFPLLGFKDGTMLLLGGKNTRFEHKQILTASEKKESDILFATSLENLDSQAKEPYLELTASRDGQFLKAGQKVKIVVGRDTDLFVAGVGIAKPGGHQILEKIFGDIAGVAINTPPHWQETTSSK